MYACLLVDASMHAVRAYMAKLDTLYWAASAGSCWGSMICSNVMICTRLQVAAVHAAKQLGSNRS